MTVVFRDVHLKRKEFFCATPCVATFENSLGQYIQNGIIYIDFHLPFLNKQQFNRNILHRKDTKRGLGIYHIINEVNTNAKLATNEKRLEWIKNVKNLYNFDSFFSYIHPKGKFVRFDFRKISGFQLFAIITCLRYYTEFPSYVIYIYKLMSKYKWNFKFAFLFIHLLCRYSDGHCLLPVDFNLEKALNFKGFETKTNLIEQSKKTGERSLLRISETLNSTFGVKESYHPSYNEIFVTKILKKAKEKDPHLVTLKTILHYLGSNVHTSKVIKGII